MAAEAAEKSRCQGTTREHEGVYPTEVEPMKRLRASEERHSHASLGAAARQARVNDDVCRVNKISGMTNTKLPSASALHSCASPKRLFLKRLKVAPVFRSDEVSPSVNTFIRQTETLQERRRQSPFGCPASTRILSAMNCIRSASESSGKTSPAIGPFKHPLARPSILNASRYVRSRDQCSAASGCAGYIVAQSMRRWSPLALRRDGNHFAE